MSRLRLCSMSVGVVCQRSYDAMPRLALGLARTCDTDRMSVAVSAVACGVRSTGGALLYLALRARWRTFPLSFVKAARPD